MTTTTTIEAYDIETTWDHAQYYPGAGVAFTDYDEVAIGMGSSEKEAIVDALDQLAMNGWDTSSIDYHAAGEDTTQLCECGEDDGCEHRYFAAIRVR